MFSSFIVLLGWIAFALAGSAFLTALIAWAIASLIPNGGLEIIPIILILVVIVNVAWMIFAFYLSPMSLTIEEGMYDAKIYQNN